MKQVGGTSSSMICESDWCSDNNTFTQQCTDGDGNVSTWSTEL